MHYNHFTIDYIKAVKKHLKIEFDSTGNAVFLPDEVTGKDITNLKDEMLALWARSHTAIDLLTSKHDSFVQSGLFGLVNDMDFALKVGFLLGDRVVLIDYLYERLLLKKNPDKINIVHLGVVASSLVNILPLAETGRVVIIPSPFGWHAESRIIMDEVIAGKTIMTIQLMSLLNMLSITKICKLHPYTIAESKAEFNSIITHQLDNVNTIGKDGAEYAYEGILGALLTEKLLTETELKVVLDIPLTKFYAIVSSNKDFYIDYLSEITNGGSLAGDNNIEKVRDRVMQAITDKSKIGVPVAKAYTLFAGVGSGAITLASAVSVVSAPLLITAALLGLSATLTGVINKKNKEESSVISVFNKLYTENP